MEALKVQSFPRFPDSPKQIFIYYSKSPVTPQVLPLKSSNISGNWEIHIQLHN